MAVDRISSSVSESTIRFTGNRVSVTVGLGVGVGVGAGDCSFLQALKIVMDDSSKMRMDLMISGKLNISI
jgi:hypothetical protein